MEIKRMLDLYCGAGGAAMGYYRAFGPDVEIIGVDIEPQPHYPFEFIQADALEFMQDGRGDGFDFYHASPPCQRFSAITKTAGTEDNHPNLVASTRHLLKMTHAPYVIENVPGAPLENPLLLCGTMFNLLVVRHRLFETVPTIWWPPRPCQHELPTVNTGRQPEPYKQYHSVVGHYPNHDYACEAMGVNWMSRTELAEAIPPAYSEWIGRQILDLLQHEQMLEEERQQLRYDYNSDFVEAMG